MNVFLHQVGKHAVNQPVASHEALPGKTIRHDGHAVMPAAARSGMSAVLLALVDDFELLGIELSQPFDDDFTDLLQGSTFLKGFTSTCSNTPSST